MNTARLLTPPHNYAVVQLPERHFPGVVFQGDSLNGLIVDLETTIAESDPEEQAACFEEIVERLHAIRDGYEAALKKEGIRLPY